jgi:hypothetical protein
MRRNDSRTNAEKNVVNINEAKHREAEGTEIEERYRALFNAIDEGFCIIEVLLGDNGEPYDYRFLEVNPHSRIKPESETLWEKQCAKLPQDMRRIGSRPMARSR